MKNQTSQDKSIMENQSNKFLDLLKRREDALNVGLNILWSLEDAKSEYNFCYLIMDHAMNSYKLSLEDSYSIFNAATVIHMSRMESNFYETCHASEKIKEWKIG